MGWFDGFPFKSKAQMEKERLLFEKRLFPFGLEQRERVLPVLRAVMNPKLRDEERLFAFISAKDAYTLEDTEEEGLRRARKMLRLQNRLQPADIPLVLALVQLDSALSSLDDYPTADQVRIAAALLD